MQLLPCTHPERQPQQQTHKLCPGSPLTLSGPPPLPLLLAPCHAGNGRQINDSENGRRYQRWARRLGTGREIFHSSAWPPSDEIKARAKQLEAYCGNVLSQHEDALTAALLGGDTGAAASIDEYICGTLVKACPAAMYQQSASEEEAKQLAIEVYAEQGALPPEPEAEAEDESDEEGAGEPANSPGSEATADEAVTVVDAGSMAAAASGSSGPAHEEF